jgi:hypothetical protein
MASFTDRKGKIHEVKDGIVPAVAMVSILRLKEDFAQRGEYLSTYGVIDHVVSQGIKSTRHYWKAAEKLKNKSEFARDAAKLFNADGSVRDAVALAQLAIAKGLVKGTPVNLSDNGNFMKEPPEEEEEYEEPTEENTAPTSAPTETSEV